ncbi:MAG TPA: methyltransferase domain-containing protein [Herpetosiphonaceae bacterium]
MEPTATAAGSRIYNRQLLSIYDVGVHGISNKLFWRCPTERIIGFYGRHLARRHLDIGVATGFILDQAIPPGATPQLTLMDLNENCLYAAAERLAPFRPALVKADVLRPLPLRPASFDSIGLGYLLHCLPGTLREKGAAFAELRTLLAPGGVVFGSTILGGLPGLPAPTRRLMDFYNSKGIFSNQRDTPELLEAALATHFSSHSVELIGCVALFAGYA